MRSTPTPDNLARAERALLDIVTMWPALEDHLMHEGGAIERVTGTPEAPLPINVRVSDLIAEVRTWAIFLGRVLLDETDWQAPRFDTTPAILHSIVTTRIGHFTNDPDPRIVEQFVEDAEHLAAKVAYIVNPRPPEVRKPRTRIRCRSTTTCPGVYYLPVSSDRDERSPELDEPPDLVCTVDPRHRAGALYWRPIALDENYRLEPAREMEDVR